jgi:hypothetical protein
VFAGATVHAIFLSKAESTGLGIGIVGFVACFVGVIRSNRFSLECYVRERYGSDSGWQQLFGPTKWAPCSVDQLHAAEQLAHDHGGKAYARPHPDGGTDLTDLDVTPAFSRVLRPLLRRHNPALVTFQSRVKDRAAGGWHLVQTKPEHRLTASAQFTFSRWL